MNSLEKANSLPIAATADSARWYAIHVRPRHEKKVVSQLQEKGITTYLPLLSETHRWSDRRKLVEIPLFPCYAFVSIADEAALRLTVLKIFGVLAFVGNQRQGTPIPDSEIEDLKTLLGSNIPFAQHPFLQVGKRVRVRGGALDGVEGILTERSGDRRLVLSVSTINRSLSVSIEGYQVELA
ncbi:MAG TPA: UpxY family transcription antiterminator [Terriglobales bacterium]|nr:UpxY family transcription antiterminator [Terriglobales bacterium]